MAEELFLDTVVKAIVKNPASVEVQKSIDDMGVFLRVKVHKDDMGLILGKQGTHSNAIKLLTKLVGMNNGVRASVKILEPEGSTRQLVTNETAK